MEIETKNASLDTMAVTIQALHVSGKQMTLAVFRQLPIASAIKENGALASLDFWGLVRYQIKDEGSLWAVASEGGILYRCDARPCFTSEVKCLRYESAAKEELELYLRWESLTIAHEKWRQIPFEERLKGASVDLPSYNYKTRYFKVGNEHHYRVEHENSVKDIALSGMMEKSVAKLAALPQLFISV